MISVIVPVYNVIEYLDRAVLSIVNQTYRDLEIILVDDGSTDGSSLECDNWSWKDERIKVIHKENGGLSDARNAGLNIATGDYVMFPDSDDYIDNDFCEKMISQMANPKVTLVCCGFLITDINGNESVSAPKERRLLSKKEAIEDIISSGNDVRPSACNKLFKRCLFDDIRFNTDVVQEDTESMPRIIDNGDMVVVTNETFYHYIKRPGSISTKREFDAKNIEFLRCMNRYASFYRTKYPELFAKYTYYQMSNYFGILSLLVRCNSSYRSFLYEMRLRVGVLRWFFKAGRFKVNRDEHWAEMINRCYRVVVGMRLTERLSKR